MNISKNLEVVLTCCGSRRKKSNSHFRMCQRCVKIVVGVIVSLEHHKRDEQDRKESYREFLVGSLKRIFDAEDKVGRNRKGDLGDE